MERSGRVLYSPVADKPPRTGPGLLIGAPVLYHPLQMNAIHFLPHAQEQIERRSISVEEVVETVVSPDRSRTGRFGRIVAEKDFGTRILRVVYNEGEDEAMVITAMPIRKRGGG